MALGASEREIKTGLFFETLLVTLSADIFVLLSVLPLAKIVSLESAVILDSKVCVVFVGASVLLCELLVCIVARTIHKQSISEMMKMRDL
jgi:ABC-type antimicrobial peptide transport system permease subunit